MTILKCSATTCAYNEDMLCSRGEINVMGDSAKSSEETSCGSFREKSQGAADPQQERNHIKPGTRDQGRELRHHAGCQIAAEHRREKCRCNRKTNESQPSKERKWLVIPEESRDRA